MTYKMFIDDERDPPNGETDWVVVRCFDDAIYHIFRNGCPTFISFDHDLGSGQTGYDIAKEIVGMDLDGSIAITNDFSFYVHSQNPVGADNIMKYLNSYLMHKRA